MRRLLITGGAGFIGTNFVRYWREREPDDQIVILDKLTYAGDLRGVSELIERGEASFVQGDIGDRKLIEELLDVERIDTVVNFAAESHVDRSIHGAAEFIQTNIMGTHNLLETACQYWKRSAVIDHWFHHVSTDEVYGSLTETEAPFTESSRYKPNSPYAASKAGSDHIVRAWGATHGLRYGVTNCSNNFGPYQYPEKLIPLSIINLLLGRAIPVYGDGKNVRDWIYVADHCAGVWLAIRAAVPGRTYNLGGNQEMTNIELVRSICARFDRAFSSRPELAAKYPESPAAKGERSDCLIEFVDDRPGHDRRYAVNSERAESELGFDREYDFEQALDATVEWYLTNDEWWRSILDGSYREWVELQYAAGSGESTCG